MTYYLYHIPGKKIGVTRNLEERVHKQQGYNKDEYTILAESKDITEISNLEIQMQKAFGYKLDRQLYKNLKCNNKMEFCKSFNGRTEKIEKGMKVPVIISVYSDKSFDFIIKTTPAAILLRKAAGIEKGSGTPNSVKVGSVTLKQVEEIAEVKMEDLNANTLEAAVKIISGSARSMGITVEN